ncbi:MAG: F0F1 ATP synthase subunit B [Flavobacteriales bacterium Tduv]
MNLLTPSFGLIVWQLIIFVVLLALLGKFAWKPIMQFIEQREENIRSSLEMAKRVEKEMYDMQILKDQLLKESRLERDSILKEARQMKDTIQAEAQKNARAESDKMIEQAKKSIHNERVAAMSSLKNYMAAISINIAEKILRKELDHKDQHRKLLQSLVDELK